MPALRGGDKFTQNKLGDAAPHVKYLRMTKKAVRWETALDLNDGGLLVLLINVDFVVKYTTVLLLCKLTRCGAVRHFC